MRCAKCGSTNITIDTQQKSKFSWGKGFLGSLLFGSGGAAAGVGGKNETKKTYHCMACGNIGDYSHVVMDGDTDASIESALRCNDVAKLQGLKRQYRNIEWTPLAPIGGGMSQPQNFSRDPDFEITYDGVLQKYNGLEVNIVIPYGVTSIGEKAFFCYPGELIPGVKTLLITIPNSVIFIEKLAFAASALKSITVPGSVISIGKRAFTTCPRLTSVEIQNGVRSIEDAAFNDCWNLTSVSIGDSVTSIGSKKDGIIGTRGKGAFQGCSDLSSIALPKNLSFLGAYSFDKTNIQSITFPDPHGWVRITEENQCYPIDENILRDPTQAAEFIKNHCADSFRKQ